MHFWKNASQSRSNYSNCTLITMFAFVIFLLFSDKPKYQYLMIGTSSRFQEGEATIKFTSDIECEVLSLENGYVLFRPILESFPPHVPFHMSYVHTS